MQMCSNKHQHTIKKNCGYNDFSEKREKICLNKGLDFIPCFLKISYIYAMDGWLTCAFVSVSTVSQSYQDDGQVVMKNCVQ